MLTSSLQSNVRMMMSTSANKSLNLLLVRLYNDLRVVLIRLKWKGDDEIS